MHLRATEVGPSNLKSWRLRPLSLIFLLPRWLARELVFVQ